MSLGLILVLAQMVEPAELERTMKRSGLSRYPGPVRSELTLSLESEPRQVHVGEPVDLTVRLKHTGKTALWGGFELSPLAKLMHVQVRKAGQDFREVVQPYTPSEPRSGALVACFDVAPRQLRPGDELVAAIVLGVDRDERKIVLDEPGRYDLRIRLQDNPRNPNRLLLSNVVTLHVLPVPPEEKAAQTALSADILVTLQAEPGLVTATQIRGAAAFADRFPQSLYAKRVRRGLLNALEHRRRSTEEERALYRTLKEEERQAPPPQGESTPQPAHRPGASR